MSNNVGVAYFATHFEERHPYYIYSYPYIPRLFFNDKKLWKLCWTIDPMQFYGQETVVAAMVDHVGEIVCKDTRGVVNCSIFAL